MAYSPPPPTVPWISREAGAVVRCRAAAGVRASAPRIRPATAIAEIAGAFDANDAWLAPPRGETVGSLLQLVARRIEHRRTERRASGVMMTPPGVWPREGPIHQWRRASPGENEDPCGNER